MTAGEFRKGMTFVIDGEPHVIIDFQHTPTQEIRDMEMVQSENGYVEMRMTAPLMQHFEYDADSLHRVYDFYPDSFYVRIYTRDGALETEIISEQARHETTAGKNTWSAFGNVQMINHIRRQRMESDTIYWDQAQHKIYTDCYVRLISEQGEMQGTEWNPMKKCGMRISENLSIRIR